MSTVAPEGRRIRSESSFEFRAPDREAAYEALNAAIDAACRAHPEVSSHHLSAHNGELEISFVLEPGRGVDPQAIVFEILETAVSSIGGRISSEDDRPDPPESMAVFEQLGTYLVPA